MSGSGSNRDEKPQSFRDEIYALLRTGSSYNVQINRFDLATKERRTRILSNLCMNAHVAQGDTPEMRDEHMEALRKFVEVTLPERLKKLKNEAKMRDPEFKKAYEWGEKIDSLYSSGLEKLSALEKIRKVEDQLQYTLLAHVESARSGKDSKLLEEFLSDLDALILRCKIQDSRESANAQIKILSEKKGEKTSLKYQNMLKTIPENMYTPEVLSKLQNFLTSVSVVMQKDEHLEEQKQEYKQEKKGWLSLFSSRSPKKTQTATNDGVSPESSPSRKRSGSG